MTHIVSLAHATPPHAIVQKELAQQIAQASNLTAAETKWLEKVYSNSAITTRYSVLEDFTKKANDWTFWNNAPPTTQARNELYKLHAPVLSKQSCALALEKWGQDPKSITHIIYISCTGIIAPGIQAYLQQALGLHPNICQFGVNMMGCFGGFKGLQMADAFCAQNPNNKVLVVCTELCSLHFQQTSSQETQIGNALFADASAACIVTHEPKGQEKSLFRIKKHSSLILANTTDKMSWEVSDTGLIFGLKKEVPDLIRQHVGNFAKSLLPQNCSAQDCLWPVHPGGKGILQSVEEALALTKEQTQASWEVLKNFGNTSSASFLLVLNELQKQKSDKKWAIGLGFGPGLCFEGIQLETM